MMVGRSVTLPLLPACVAAIALISSSTWLTGCGSQPELSRQQEEPSAAVGVQPVTTETDAVSKVDVTVKSASPAEAALIQASASALEADLIDAVSIGNPPEGFVPLEGYPGDTWLYIDVRLSDADPEGMRVTQDWQAARLAGEIRNAAAAANLPIPFGYSMTGILPDGTTTEPISIAIGAPLGTHAPPILDQAAAAARMEQAVSDLGLSLRSVEFKGDAAVMVRVETRDEPTRAIERWPEILQGLVGDNKEGAWLVEIANANGRPIKALAHSPATAGADGWTRPDLREFEVQMTGGF